MAIEISFPPRDRQILMTIGPGDTFGWPALIESGTATASARAIEQVELLRIEGKLLRDLCSEDPRLGLELSVPDGVYICTSSGSAHGVKSSKIVAGVTVAFLNLAICTVANATDVPELNQFGWSDDFYILRLRRLSRLLCAGDRYRRLRCTAILGRNCRYQTHMRWYRITPSPSHPFVAAAAGARLDVRRVRRRCGFHLRGV